MQVLGLVIDGIILVLLAATVFYAARLSLALKQFREGKAEFAQLLNQLHQATSQADQSILNLQKSTEDSGHNLQMRINSAKSLSDELQLMTEAATNLADRLEGMAGKNREIVRRMERAAGMGGEALDLGGNLNAESPGESNFSLRDTDAGHLDEDIHADDNIDDIDTGEYASRAEKELAEALKKQRR